jgi:hypothetical protein
MTELLRNRLSESASAYLRSAADQPVFWQEWTEEAFSLAKKLDRPILLDIGAVWCHWCHVMDRESYKDSEIASLINNHFVPIRVDRDRRPDIDWRYQSAVCALTGTGGWPLTVFLLPDGEPFLGATYVPREDRYGIIGFKTLLEKVSQVYREERTSLTDLSRTIHKRLLSIDEEVESGSISRENVIAACASVLTNLDGENGGLTRTGPKFPSECALQLALTGAYYLGNDRLLHAVAFTLSKMASGGIHDHLGGGFHRYSVDPCWIVPHFEKMLRTNSYLLSLYLNAFAATGNQQFKEVALSIISYIDRNLFDKNSGAFFASQDASSPDGGEEYYTWTGDQLREVLPEEEFNLLQLYYGVQAEPRLIKGLPRSNILRVSKSRREISEILGITIDKISKLLDSGKKHLFDARCARPAPTVDQTIYADANGAAAVAYLDAYRVLGLEEAKDKALRALNFVLSNMRSPEGAIFHAFAYGKPQIVGLLEDAVWVGLACLSAFEATGESKYTDEAVAIAKNIVNNYQDREKGGFYDTIGKNNEAPFVTQRRKRFLDSTEPATSPLAVLYLDRLSLITGDDSTREAAERALNSFAGSSARHGYYAATYALAVHYHLYPPARVIVAGSRKDRRARELFQAGLSTYRPGTLVLFADSVAAGDRYPALADGAPLAYVCAGTSCAAPVKTPEMLRSALLSFAVPKSREQSRKNSI